MLEALLYELSEISDTFALRFYSRNVIYNKIIFLTRCHEIYNFDIWCSSSVKTCIDVQSRKQA